MRLQDSFHKSILRNSDQLLKPNPTIFHLTFNLNVLSLQKF